jgi:hypothetical protein
MSLVEKVAALRTFFGLLPSLELLPAVTSMNTLMGIVGEGPLPQQVDSLIAATGVTITTPGRAPAAAPAAAAAAAAAPVDAAVGKKRAAPESAPPLKHQRARTMEHMFPQAEKTEIRAEELRKQRVAAAAGMDYKPRDSLVAEWSSQRNSGSSTAPPKPAKAYPCSRCPRTFTSASSAGCCWRRRRGPRRLSLSFLRWSDGALGRGRHRFLMSAEQNARLVS